MKYTIIAILLTISASCKGPNPKQDTILAPKHPTEIADPELKSMVDEFFTLSIENDLIFTNKVHIGFGKIDRGETIGVCKYRLNFREIELDSIFWDRATHLSKKALVFHELTHCYCDRGHDYNNGDQYPDNSFKSIIERFFSIKPKKEDGYLKDGCPKSLMHPTSLNDYCFVRHYDYYTKEMFTRCVAY